jgi:hypothetical protein
MAKSPVFWIWIGTTVVAAAVNVMWARNPGAFGTVALVGVNLLATAVTLVFVGIAMLKALATSNVEGRTTKD